ncbi:MAG: hypothetical protein NTX63_00795 [Candidatus Peregrinibacteria bacterium]|nr:hypothetical protein [Candidatus Peregrinibacteria bacterium]
MMVYRPYNRVSAHKVHRKRFSDYFLPPFLFIAFAVIVILSVQLYQSIFVDHKPLDVFLSTLEGRTKLTVAGSPNADDALNETRLFKGDEIATETSSRAGLNFFKREVLRFDGETTALLQDVSQEKSQDTIDMVLKGGRAWIFSETPSGISSDLLFHTTHLSLESQGGVFEIEDLSAKKGSEIVRVIKGSVKAKIIIASDSGPKEVESVTIAAGQQFTMDPLALAAYEKFQSPEVIAPIDPKFVEDEWYLWNNGLDEKGSR